MPFLSPELFQASAWSPDRAAALKSKATLHFEDKSISQTAQQRSLQEILFGLS